MKPSNGLNIQVIGRFIEEKEVDLHEHGTAESDSHLPSSRKRVDGEILSFRSETHLFEHGSDLLLGSVDARFIDHELADGDTGFVSFDIVFDVSGLEILGEVVDLLSVDSLEEGRFTTSVGTTDTVSVTSTKFEDSVVEEEETTVSEGEGQVASEFTLFVVVEIGTFDVVSLLLDVHPASKFVGSDRISRILSNRGDEVRSDVNRLPVLVSERTLANEVGDGE